MFKGKIVKVKVRNVGKLEAKPKKSKKCVQKITK
jgi:hypothetical protein